MLEVVKDALNSGERLELEEPRPLVREIAVPEPYPIDALGSLRQAAMAIHEHTRAPIAICAQALLGALSLVGQAHADVELPTGQKRPLSVFLLTIAESGARKTAVDGYALRPIYDREAQLRDAYAIELIEYETANAIYEAHRANALKEIKKKKQDSSTAGEADLRALGPAPEQPLTPMLVCPEPTVEGYLRLTAGGHPALGLYSAEGGSFIGGFGMSPDHRLKTAASLSGLWDGDPIKRVRAGDGATTLAGRRLAAHLMAQHDVAAQLINDDLLISQGLVSRILLSAPVSTAGTRFFLRPSTAAQADLARYHERMAEFLQIPQPLRAGKRNELDPRTLKMSPEAQQIWIEFHDFVEAQLAPDGDFEVIAGLANKAAEHAARIAGLLALWTDFKTSEISAAAMANGTIIIQHHLAEMIRLRDLASVNPHLKLCQKVLEWLHTSWNEPAIFPALIYQRGPVRQVRDRETALKVIGTLEDHGHLIRIDGGARISGRKRKEAWLIHGRSMP
ncbi:MAG: YfjI family protein [Pseudomonadota bacterium]